MTDIVGIPAILHIACSKGERTASRDLQGFLDGDGTFYYLEQEGADHYNTIPRANLISSGTKIQFPDSGLTIRTDGHGSLVVQAPQGWTEETTSRKIVHPEFVERHGTEMLVPATFGVGLDIPIPFDPVTQKSTQRVDVIFEAAR